MENYFFCAMCIPGSNIEQHYIVIPVYEGLNFFEKTCLLSHFLPLEGLFILGIMSIRHSKTILWLKINYLHYLSSILIFLASFWHEIMKENEEFNNSFHPLIMIVFSFCEQTIYFLEGVNFIIWIDKSWTTGPVPSTKNDAKKSLKNCIAVTLSIRISHYGITYGDNLTQTSL